MKERDRLLQECGELAKSVNVLQSSIKETRMTVQEKEKELASHQLAFQNLERSSFMLQHFAKQTEQQIKKLDHIASNLEKNLQALFIHSEKDMDISRFKIDVEVMCQKLQQSLVELTQEEPRMEKIQDVKKSVRNSLADLMKTVPRPLLLRLIQEQQETDISNWSKMSASSLPPTINSESDPDASAREQVQPLQKLLYELAWFYTDSRSRGAKAKKQAAGLKEKLNTLDFELRRQLDSHFSTAEEGQLLIDVALQLTQVEIQEAKRKAAAESLRNALSNLENFCLRSEACQADIEQKIVTIERNSRMADHLNSLICTLARKHVENPRAIQQSITRLQCVTDEEIKAARSHLSKNVDLSKDSVLKEMEQFRQLKPCQLFNISIEK